MVLIYGRHTSAALALVATVAVAGCNAQGVLSGQPGTTADAPAVGASSGDLHMVSALSQPQGGKNGAFRRIHPDDVLTIDVFAVDSLDRTVRVDESGTIELPFLGSVNAAGRSVAELETQLEKLYGADNLENPEISVFVKESSAQSATLDGAFEKPGTLPVTEATTLLRLVADGGGLTRLADDRKVFVFRKVGERTQVWRASITAIREGRMKDPSIYPGDLVVAFESRAKVAFSHLRDVALAANSASRVLSPL